MCRCGVTYEPGRVLAADESSRPYLTWVLYSAKVDEQDGPVEAFAAVYADGALVRRDEAGFFRFDWRRFDFVSLPPRLRLNKATLARAHACARPGWPLLPSQAGLA